MAIKKYPRSNIDFTNPVNIKYLKRWGVLPGYERSGSDAYWFKDCVITIDEARANLAKLDPTIDPYRPFPIEEECYRKLLTLFRTENVLWVRKSRRLLFTWIACAFLLKNACFTKGSNNFIIQKTLGDVDDLLKERCMFIYDNIPTNHWDDEYKCTVNLKALHPYVEHVRYVIRVPEMNSHIKAVASGEHKIRGKTGSIVFWDEIAFNDKILPTWEALFHVKRGGGQIIGGTTMFDNDWLTLWDGIAGAVNEQIV